MCVQGAIESCWGADDNEHHAFDAHLFLSLEWTTQRVDVLLRMPWRESLDQGAPEMATDFRIRSEAGADDPQREDDEPSHDARPCHAVGVGCVGMID